MEKAHQTPKTIVVKIGSAVLVHDDGTLQTELIRHIAGQIQEIQKEGISIILVVSGAVAIGKKYIQNGTSTVGKQIYAGVGQAYLTAAFWNAFHDTGMVLSQFLLTKSHLHSRNTANLHMALMHTVHHDAIPFINENDAVLPNCFGGNDHLAAKIAHIVQADKLIILTNVDGLLTAKSSKGHVIHNVSHVTPEIMRFIWAEKSKTGFGGMWSKLVVAKELSGDKIPTIIANGLTQNILTRLLLEGHHMGTWINYHENSS